MSVESFVEEFDVDKLRAKVHFDLRHNSLSSDNWEKAITYAMGGVWVPGGNDLADCYSPEHNVCVSVKTRKIDPQLRTRVPSRDFFSNPSHFHFGGVKFSEHDLDNIHTVNGRTSIVGLDEQKSSAFDIGTAAIARYYDFEHASLNKFKCNDTVNVVAVHGMSKDLESYNIRLMMFGHELNPIVNWEDCKFDGPRTKYHGHRSMVLGYDENGPHIARISNLGRQQTAFIRFYRQSEALKVIDTSIPMPDYEEFDYDHERTLL